MRPKPLPGFQVGRDSAKGNDATSVVVMERDPETGRMRIVEEREVQRRRKAK